VLPVWFYSMPTSLFMVQQVSKKLGLTYTPSAFQIRFGGCKGVLSTWPSLDGEKIQIRRSMKKFESDHNKLDVVNYSSPGTAMCCAHWRHFATTTRKSSFLLPFPFPSHRIAAPTIQPEVWKAARSYQGWKKLVFLEKSL